MKSAFEIRGIKGLLQRVDNIHIFRRINIDMPHAGKIIIL